LLALGGEKVLYLHISLCLIQERSALAFPAIQDKIEMNRDCHSFYRMMTEGAIAPCGCHLQCPSVNAVVPCEGHPSHLISPPPECKSMFGGKHGEGPGPGTGPKEVDDWCTAPRCTLSHLDQSVVVIGLKSSR